MADFAKTVLLAYMTSCLILGTSGHYGYYHHDNPFSWSTWGTWSACHVDCSLPATHYFEQIRTRECHDTRFYHNAPSYRCGVALDQVDIRLCPNDCSTNGYFGHHHHEHTQYSWGTWSTWSSCDAHCSLLTMFTFQTVRVRYCHSSHQNCDVPHQYCGNKAEQTQSRICPNKCAVDGGWGTWGKWPTCSRSCGLGLKTRHRSCDNPTPKNGGKTCVGSSSMPSACYLGECPIDGGWTSFTTSPCSVTCGTGVVVKNRTCSNPAPAFGGKDCVGSEIERVQCKSQDCDIDGGWSQWTNWTNCDAVCGHGHTMRSRTCTNPTPAGSGANCTGSAHERQLCQNGTCSSAFKTCYDDDIKQMVNANPFVIGSNPSPAVACSSPESMQELLLSKICHVTTTSLDWTLGPQLSANCEKVPLYSPVTLIDKQTQSRKYGILLDCYHKVIQILDFSCRMKIQVIPLNHTTTDHHVLLM